MTDVFIRYQTTTGIEKTVKFDTAETKINLDLRDIQSIDLLPLIWCTSLQDLSLRNNQIVHLDLTPLAKCKSLICLALNNNKIESIDFSPLSSCKKLEEIFLKKNNLSRIDISPLFQCSNLQTFEIDESVSMTANMLLRSIGNWPSVLVQQYGKILWKVPRKS
ncbi:MAG: leucine-rich repeat protein [Candidatus Lokiarchaeota archaeon]|nr:leucine-rich repeat protein [Candidatus Lokiarchaeota archaeon]